MHLLLNFHSFLLDCPIAPPYSKGEEGENAGLCAVIFKMTQFWLCRRNGESKVACWTLCSVFCWDFFLAQFFSPITSSPSIDSPLTYASVMKRSWVLESRPGKGWTVFDLLLNSAGLAPEVGGCKGRDPALGWTCSDLPLNTEGGSPWPWWLEGMQRALEHANEGDFIRFSETKHKSILFCRSLGLPHFFSLGNIQYPRTTGKDAAGERGWLCPLFSPQYAAQWKLDFILPGTKQSQPKPEIIITKESCLGSFHQPGEQLVWDFLKHFFMARQI